MKNRVFCLASSKQEASQTLDQFLHKLKLIPKDCDSKSATNEENQNDDIRHVALCNRCNKKDTSKRFPDQPLRSRTSSTVSSLSAVIALVPHCLSSAVVEASANGVPSVLEFQSYLSSFVVQQTVGKWRGLVVPLPRASINLTVHTHGH